MLPVFAFEDAFETFAAFAPLNFVILVVECFDVVAAVVVCVESVVDAALVVGDAVVIALAVVVDADNVGEVDAYVNVADVTLVLAGADVSWVVEQAVEDIQDMDALDEKVGIHMMLAGTLSSLLVAVVVLLQH